MTSPTATPAADRQTTATREAPILEVDGLSVEFGRTPLLERLRRRPGDQTMALSDVSLSVLAGDTLGVIGESGSGKTTLARTLVRLVEPNAGTVRFRGHDIAGLKGSALANVRRKIQLIYQDPYSSLNPALTVGSTIAEPALVHRLVDKSNVQDHVAELMNQVGLNSSLMTRRPSALSGGQRQRVAIARSLAAGPEILIADEAVSALDVSIQAQILNLFARLQQDLGLTLIFVSHQLATVAQLCDRVIIMYRGRLVESGPTREVFASPKHGYTQALIEAHPGQGRLRERKHTALGPTMQDAPSPAARGCPFRHRCVFAREICENEQPSPILVTADHWASCHVLTRAQADCTNGKAGGGIGFQAQSTI